MQHIRSIRVAFGAAALLALALPAIARANGTLALTGQVSSQKEGLMEGVVVGAKKDGSTITVNVVSDAKGRFGIPAAKLDPGRYSLTIRAVGYDLAGPTTL